MQRGPDRTISVKRSPEIHTSWQIAALCVGLLTGIAIAATRLTMFATAWQWLLLTVALIVLAFSKRNPGFIILAVVSGLALGLWRGSVEQQALQQYHQFIDKTVSLQGKVSEDPSEGQQHDVRVQLVHVHIDGRPLHGKVWSSILTKQTIKRGDTVVLTGKLKEGFGNMPASMASAKLADIRATNKSDIALQVRDWFANGVRQAIPEPQASLGNGFLVGQHSSLPGTLNDDLKVVGLTHAVVASGSNLTLLVGLARRSMMRVSKFSATLAGSLMTAGFVMITGLSPSMTRAGLVTALSLAAWYYGRRIHPMVLIPFAAGITALLNPSYIWGDIGWYLSFGSFVGVLILAPLLQHYFWGKDFKPGVVTEILIGTTAAQLATMPVTLFSFGTYSSYALLANMLVLPLVPFAMGLTFLAGIAGLAVPSIAVVIGFPATMIMRYMTAVVGWVAHLPGAQGQVGYGQLALIGSYILMILLTAYMWRRTSHNFGTDNSVIIGERP